MTGRTQLFEVSNAYQVLVIAAGLDSGRFEEADRRVLLTSLNGAVPEAARPIADDPVVAALKDRFTAIVSYNQLISPLHPKGFWPRPTEQAVFSRLFRNELGIPGSDALELAVESVHVPPARSLANVFSDAAITVYAEGLMSYGPTRDPLPPALTGRIERVLHLDLVPGLTPALLAEFGVPSESIPDEAFRAAVAAVSPAPVSGEPAASTSPPAAYALILGQYLADLGLLTGAAEGAMYADLVDAAAAAGFRRVVFKPHPSAPGRYREELAARAAKAGVAFEVDRRTSPVETLYASDPPGLVLGCFSTGLVTARMWDVPAASLGTSRVLAALPKYEDSNRVPLVIVDRTVPKVVREGGEFRIEPALDPAGGERLERILGVVGYGMQWRSHSGDRDTASAELADPQSPAGAYVTQARRRRLLLPGGFPVAADATGFERAQRVANRLVVGRAAAKDVLARTKAGIAGAPPPSARDPEP